MNAIREFLSGPAWQHLALALLHTLWQGLAAAAVLGLLLRRVPAHRPGARYALALATLAVVVLGGFVTWSVLDLEQPSSIAAANPQAASSVARAGSSSILVANSAALSSDTRHASFPAAQSGSEPQESPWLPLLVAGWLIGVAVMLARMIWTVAGLRRVAAGPEIADRRVRELVDELRRLLQLARPIRIVETAAAFGPAVLGIARPVLALPVSMLTGLPPDVLRAILAHELAHIRRHDYLWNLAQMVVEAVLFFNPAVWWISRQIRIEREACCDALAVSVLGQPAAVAEALLLWAERQRIRSLWAAAPAWSGGKGPRLLLDRARRIMLSGYRPQLPISPLGASGVVLLGLLALGGLWLSTSAAVQLAAKVLTPAERIERIVETQQQYAPAEISPTPEGKGRVLSGILRAADDKPVPRKIHGNAFTHSASTSTSTQFDVWPPKFSVNVPSGETSLCFQCEDYAPVVVGPFSGKPGEPISGIEVVLDHGFPLMVRVVDAKGQPVEGAAVSGGVSNFGATPTPHPTDAKGVAVIPHAAERTYWFSVRKPGFEPLVVNNVTVKPVRTATLSLVSTKPVRGVVLSAEGRPVAGAEIRDFWRFYPNHQHDYSATREVLTTTDSEGRFVLDELYNEPTYCLLVVAKGHGRCLIDGLTTKTKNVKVKLAPELTITGVVHGDLNALKKNTVKPSVRAEQRVPVGAVGEKTIRWPYVTVEPTEGGGKFSVEGLMPGDVTIVAGEHKVQTSVSAEKPHADVTIDLAKPLVRPATRRVVLHFVTLEGKVAPQGSVSIDMNAIGPGPGQVHKELPIIDGRVRLDALVPGMLSYRPKDLVGYWFSSESTRVEAGEDTLVVAVSVVPAGAIAGQIVDAEGMPETKEVSINIQGTVKWPGGTTSGGFANSRQTNDGKFFLSPIPLGGEYNVMATVGHRIQIMGPITVDDVHPVADVGLQIPRATSASGIVTDAAGKPLPHIPVSLDYLDAKRKASHGWSGTATDQNGRYQFDDLNAEGGEYSLTFEPRRDYCPAHVALPRDGRPLTVRLERGDVVEGQVLDRDTGWPIPRAVVYATPNPISDGQVCEAEAPTDEDGRFRFSNLADRTYHFMVREVLNDESESERVRRPGKEPLTLRVSLPEWSRLKPRRPAEHE